MFGTRPIEPVGFGAGRVGVAGGATSVGLACAGGLVEPVVPVAPAEDGRAPEVAGVAELAGAAAAEGGALGVAGTTVAAGVL